MKVSFLYALAAIMFAGCQTKIVTEAEQFDASIRKELPFAVDSLRWLDGAGFIQTEIHRMKPSNATIIGVKP